MSNIDFMTRGTRGNGFQGARIDSNGHFTRNAMGSNFFEDLFGVEGWQSVQQAGQQAGATYVTNYLGEQVAVNPEAAAALAAAAAGAGKSGFEAVWAEHKWKILGVSGIFMFFIVFGAYNMLQKKR